MLYVHDLERSRRFYRDVLGWNEIVEMGGMAAIEIELYIDVQPEIWRNNPAAIAAPPRPLRV